MSNPAMAGCQTYLDLLQRRAAEQPCDPAFAFLHDGESCEQALTYGEMDMRARAIGAALQSAGAKGGQVLILCPPGLDYVAASFACFYAGAVCVPLYTSLLEGDPEPLKRLVAVTGASVAVTTSALYPLVERIGAASSVASGLRWVVADRVPDGMGVDWRSPLLSPSAGAYMLMTSGSTAAPKAILLSHGALLHDIAFLQERLGTSAPGSCVVSWLPPYHSMTILSSTLTPLVAGIPAILMSPAAFLERPVRWLETIAAYRATHSAAPNFAYDLCARTIDPSDHAPLDLSSWAVAFCGGETIRPETLERFTEVFAPWGFRPEALFQAYGLSETMLISGGVRGKRPVVSRFANGALEYGKVAAGDAEGEAERALVSCGPVLGDRRVAVVEPETKLECQPNEVGEIWLANPGLADGYWGQPEETEQAFGAHLADTGEGPFFRTGDLGFFYQGELYLCGRIKEVINIRGRNLYPQDVELTAEMSHPALKPVSGAAFSVESEGDERLVIAHEIAAHDQVVDVDEIVASIRRAVTARHQMPVYSVALLPSGSLPKTASGKIQRSTCRSLFLADALPAIHVRTDSQHAGATGRGEYVPSQTPSQETLVEIWEHVLQVERIGIHDNYFELGGDSLLSMQIVTRASQAGIALTVEQLYEFPTIAELSALTGAAAGTAVEQGLIVGPVTLTARERRFFEENPADYDHFAPGALTPLREVVDPALMKVAIESVVKHHDGLRSRFRKVDGVWNREILPHEEQRVFKVVDLAAVDESEQERAMMAIGAEERNTISLTDGPLVQVVLFILGGNRPSRFFLTAHHLAMDGFSMRLLLEDIDSAYRQLCRGEDVLLPPKTTSVKAWADRWAYYAQSSEVAADAAYWLGPEWHRVPPVPVDRPHGRNTQGSARVAFRRLRVEETAALLRNVPRAFGTGINDVLLTALVTSYARWTGISSLMVDLKAHGRNTVFSDMDVSRTAGWFTTVFPVLLDISGAPDVLTALPLIRQQLRAVPQHGLVHGYLRYVREDEELQAQLAGMPCPDVSFNYQGQFDQVFSEPSLFGPGHKILGAAFDGEGHNLYRIGVAARLVDGEMRVRFRYSENLYDRSSIEAWAEAYVGVLREMIVSARTGDLVRS